MHENELDLIHERNAFLTQIIKDNRLHEKYCSAFSTAKGDFANMFQGMAERNCYCWLDKDNEAEEGKGFAAYHIESKTLGTVAYKNRHFAYVFLLKDHPNLSPNYEDPNYWGKSFYIVEVTVQIPTESTE